MAKYNHQPFEDWVLERDSLPPEQEQALSICKVAQPVAS